MIFELWDIETGNVVTTYPTEEAALAVVRQTALLHGRAYATSWALGSEADGDESSDVLEGADLVERALQGISAS